MYKSLIFYSKRPLKELRVLVEAHQEEFDLILEEEFSESELTLFEKEIDEIALIEFSPILVDLSFDDFFVKESDELKFREFFSKCQSMVTLDHLPYLDSNSFQVAYIKNLLWSLGDVLVDRGGSHDLMSSVDFLELLKKYKSLDKIKKIAPAAKAPVLNDPLEKLLLEIYGLIHQGKEVQVTDTSEKVSRIYHLVKSKDMDSQTLYKESGLNLKDYGDSMERLRILLKKS